MNINIVYIVYCNVMKVHESHIYKVIFPESFKMGKYLPICTVRRKMPDFGVPLAYEIIPEFPSYLVSNRGYVVKEIGGPPLTMSPTQYGDLTVGLMKDNYQYRRSVKTLVARAFVAGETEVFDTPVLLDGNRNNLHFKNIAWRPRWHAIAYIKQFDKQEDWWFLGPIMDMDTKQVYTNFIEAAISTGTLVSDIRNGYLNGTRVFPSGHTFYFLNT